jgi:hypothetical protein
MRNEDKSNGALKRISRIDANPNFSTPNVMQIVRHSHKIVFQMADVAVLRELVQTILERIGRLRIGNHDVRMKEETQESHENNARKRCLRVREKMGAGSQKRHRNSPVTKNSRNGLEKSPCKRVQQEENHEKAHAVGGQHTIPEIPSSIYKIMQPIIYNEHD